MKGGLGKIRLLLGKSKNRWGKKNIPGARERERERTAKKNSWRKRERERTGSGNTALLYRFLLKIRSVRILDTIVCSGSLVWLFSPAWAAVKLTLAGGWLHLSFRGHRPY